MKKTLHVLVLLLLLTRFTQAQITTPIIKANFGVDGELRSNYFYSFLQSGNDDWFRLPGTPGSGDFVIDTTGAANMIAKYAIDPVSRRLPFFRTMRYPPYSLMNNKRIIDAVFIRDYHGDDSTVYSSGNKNGMSPQQWDCPVSQSVPDKNEILDMFVHVRREGPGATDSLWMFGGISIENTTGDRYFDFEMYQTDIYYDRASRKFYGYGPDLGHTSWQFNGAGDITVPGDIIFTAEYSTSSLTNVEARIWVNKSALLFIPQDFDWTGSFDGASNSSQFGYAGIKPKTAGPFYTGLTSLNNTWAGPFSLIRSDNSLVTTYITNQFMEFSINLSKIGLDPVNLLGANSCGMPFRRILVKSRASTSFTAELKDFVGPFDFFLAPRADIAANIPFFCGSPTGVSQISVTNAISTSVYTWSTPDGTIASTSADGTSITVTAPGTYIVTQQLQTGCSTYATDTVTITYDIHCALLPRNILDFRASASNDKATVSWKISGNESVKNFMVERSADGIHFLPVAEILPSEDPAGTSYSTGNDISGMNVPIIYYRLKTTDINGTTQISKTVSVMLRTTLAMKAVISPNPVKDVLRINIYSPAEKNIQLYIYDAAGQLLFKKDSRVGKGTNTIAVDNFINWAKGIYPVKIVAGNEIVTDRLIKQ
ncbi:MAG: T9SS type A sorting domain-containing protein [Chitinophagaceae bacterium]